MEPVEAKMRFIIPTEVLSVQEEFRPFYVSGFGADCVIENRSIGWFVFFKGSHESLCLGTEKPELNAGDRIKITIEREVDARV